MGADGTATGQFPCAGAVTERFGRQCADRAQVDHVTGQFGIHRLADKAGDFGMFATVEHAEFHDAGNFLPEANAARAMDAARHFFRGDQRADFFGYDSTLFFFIARSRCAVSDGEILQLALAALIADRAIKWVIDQQELHDAFLCIDGLVAVRANDHAVGHRCRACGQRLRRLFNFNQAHAAVRRNGQFLVIAKMRDVGAKLVGSVHHHAAFLHLDFFAVNFDFNHGSVFCRRVRDAHRIY